jgi:hypothetical protein
MDTREAAFNASLQKPDHGAANFRFRAIPPIRIRDYFRAEE